MRVEDRIYEAAFVPELWTDVLQDLAMSIEAEGALLANLSDPGSPWIVTPGVTELYRDFFEDGWGYDNAKTKALMTIPHQGFICDAHHLSDEWMAEQPIYRDFLWKKGFGYAVGTTIHIPSGDVLAISIELKRGRAATNQKQLDGLDTLRPHLARAAMLASRLAFTRMEAALQALQIADLPAAMIRDDGRVIGCNRAFTSCTSHVTIESRDRLRFGNKQADGFFEAFLAQQATGDDLAKSNGYSLPLAAVKDTPPAVVHVLPIKGAARDLFLRTAFLLILTPVTRVETLSADILQGLFDLTPSEARVGQKLAGGGTVKTIAEDFGIGVETVRSHVKSILAKSGLDRQIDFVATVSTIRSVKTG